MRSIFQRLTSPFLARDLGARDRALDVVRGLAIMGMILVNHSPPTGNLYGFVQHAAWTGWTFADTIFPAFLFLVGAAVTYSARRGGGRVAVTRIVRRTLLLVALSVVLINFPYYDLTALKFHGTLARIGYCYFVVALLHRFTGWRMQLALLIALLVAQAAWLLGVDVPGVGTGVLEPGRNAALYLDRLALGDYVARMGRLPEMHGLVASAGAVASTLAGAVAGRFLGAHSPGLRRARSLAMAGVVLTGLGLAADAVLPISKPLWTGSYVVLMSGITLLAIAAADVLLTRPAGSWALKPLEIAGVNALFFYLFAQGLQRVFVYARVTGPDGAPVQLRVWLWERLFEPWVDGKPGALLFALVYLALCYALVHWLYRRRLFVKL